MTAGMCSPPGVATIEFLQAVFAGEIVLADMVDWDWALTFVDADGPWMRPLPHPVVEADGYPLLRWEEPWGEFTLRCDGVAPYWMLVAGGASLGPRLSPVVSGLAGAPYGPS